MTAASSHLEDLIGAYALDAVDPAERRLVEDHLRGCDRCRLELAELSEAAVHLSDGLQMAPPADLRSRVLSQATAQAQSAEISGEMTQSSEAARRAAPPGGRAIWGLAAAGLLAVGGWGIWQGVGDDLSPVDQVIQADDARTFDTQYEGETITVVASSTLDRAVIITEDLPALPDDQVYQAWWVDENENVLSAGVLEGAANTANSEVALQGDPDQRVAVAVSIEPLGGSESPTSVPVAVVPLQS